MFSGFLLHQRILKKCANYNTLDECPSLCSICNETVTISTDSTGTTWPFFCTLFASSVDAIVIQLI